MGGKMSIGKELKLKLLQNYFAIEGNVATLNLVYDTFAELVNPNFGDGNIEKLNDKLFSDIKEAVALLPRKFKLDLRVDIKDFGDYTKEECERIIRENIYLLAYRAFKDGSRKLISGGTLIGVGAAILVVSYFLHNYELWFDLINISGTLFVWEGVNMAFLERNLENKAMRAVARSIRNITIDSAPTDNAPTDNAPTDKEQTENAPVDNAPNSAIDNGSTDSLLDIDGASQDNASCEEEN